MIIKDIATGKYVKIPKNPNYYSNIIFKKYGINLNCPKEDYSQIIINRIKKLY